MKLHDEGAPPREFKIDITKEEQQLANQLLNPEKPQPMRKAGITKSALKTPRVGRENYDQVIFDHIKKGYFGEQNLWIWRKLPDQGPKMPPLVFVNVHLQLFQTQCQCGWQGIDGTMAQ